MDERIANLGGSSAGWVPKESFTAARFEVKTGRRLSRVSAQDKVDLNINCDWVDDTGEFLDAVGPFTRAEIRADLETDALRSLEHHFADPRKGSPVIELAGLPEREAAIVERAAQQWAAQYNKNFHILRD